MRNHSILVMTMMILWAGTTADAKYSGGTGEPNDPYRIATAADLNDIGNYEEDGDKHFILINDVNLAEYTGRQFNRIGTDWQKPFIGVFDGNGHKILNFTWNSTDVDYIGVGVFRYVGSKGVIKNLRVENVNISSENSYHVGSLVGANGGTIQGCYATGNITAYLSVGGLVGLNSDGGTITGCHSATNVSGQGGIGGLAGENYYGIITNCSSTGTIVGDQSVGGLVGTMVGVCVPGTIIKDCYSTATVSGKDEVGGLVGRNEWEITNCYATGSVTGWWATGGLVGGNRLDGTITNCYSTGTVSGDYYTGGLAGYNGGKITNCYSVSNVCGTKYHLGGLVGENGGIVTACYSTGNVSGDAECSGGLVGQNGRGNISDCYSMSSVDANNYVGGLVGENSDGIIINSYSTGNIAGSNCVGGLIGCGGGTINCFWDIETSGQSNSNGGTGKSTAEMKMASTFFGWNGCGEILWTLDEGRDYPRLAWENRPGQLLPEQQLSDFLEGAGTESDPYLVSTADQLNLIGQFVCEWDKHFQLVSDINLPQHSGAEFNLIGNLCHPFTGVFDGNDHTIWNFTWTSAGRNYIGLFRCLDDAGEIKNLAMENVDVNAENGECVGSLVGANNGGIISNCYSTGTVLGQDIVGGLVGANSSGTIRACHSTGTVSGDNSVAGLLAINDSGTITSCYSSSTVSGRQRVAGLVAYMWRTCAVINCYATGNITGENCVGGLVAYNDEYGTIINNCYSTGNVDGNEYVGGLIGTNRWDNTITSCNSTSAVRGHKCVGGLIGENGASTISGCCSTGSVDGKEFVGGLVGYNGCGRITGCYSRGAVTGKTGVGGLIGYLVGYDDDEVVVLRDCYSTGSAEANEFVGGLLGYNYKATIANCYSTGAVDGNGHTGGFVGDSNEGMITGSFWDINTSGQNKSPAGGTGKMTAEMKTMTTFTDAGWDFVVETTNGTNDFWRMCVDDVNYPLLSWQFIGDFACPDGVDIFDLQFFIERWLTACSQNNNFCNCTDMNYDELVNFPCVLC